MNRLEAMQAVAAARSDAAVITGPGANSGLLYEMADAPATIYNMDMGYASAMALGMAMACPLRPILAIEGEGSFYAGSVVLSTIWRLRPDNLVVLVLDNGVWGTGDNLEPTATALGVDLPASRLPTAGTRGMCTVRRRQWSSGTNCRRRCGAAGRILSSARPTSPRTCHRLPPGHVRSVISSTARFSCERT